MSYESFQNFRREQHLSVDSLILCTFEYTYGSHVQLGKMSYYFGPKFAAFRGAVTPQPLIAFSHFRVVAEDHRLLFAWYAHRVAWKKRDELRGKSKKQTSVYVICNTRDIRMGYKKGNFFHSKSITVRSHILHLLGYGTFKMVHGSPLGDCMFLLGHTISDMQSFCMWGLQYVIPT